MSTKIKLCGMSRIEDIKAVNELKPDYIGFVFFAKSIRNVTPKKAAELKAALDPAIRVMGVFVDSPVEFVAGLQNAGTIDIAQLHGHEDNDYIAKLKSLTGGKPVLQAFKAKEQADVLRAMQSDADELLLDSGMGSGECFDWSLTAASERPFFLAGGLTPENVTAALEQIKP